MTNLLLFVEAPALLVQVIVDGVLVGALFAVAASAFATQPEPTEKSSTPRAAATLHHIPAWKKPSRRSSSSTPVSPRVSSTRRAYSRRTKVWISASSPQAA